MTYQDTMKTSLNVFFLSKKIFLLEGSRNLDTKNMTYDSHCGKSTKGKCCNSETTFLILHTLLDVIP